MARVTVEDCLARVPNRFALTILASRRARALSEGRGRALVDCENKEGVTALREISGDNVRYREDVESTMHEFIEEQRRQLRVTTGEHTFLEAASLRALEDEDVEEEEETLDIEELSPDPEALGKQAKGDTDEEEAEAEEEEESEDSDDAETSSDDDFDAAPAFDDEDIPETDDEEEASESEDEEEE